jgi:YaiO family outer membrane protein
MRKCIRIFLFSAGILSTTITLAASDANLNAINYRNRTNQALRLIKTAEAVTTTPLNELGFDQDEAYVSDIGGYWSYSSIHYYRFTKYGVFGARVNYADRYANGGEQYQLEAYPKLVKNFYFIVDSYIELTGAKSNTSQRVFPQYQYSIEPYLTLPNDYEVSFGQRYSRGYGVNIYTYTGSIGKYLDDGKYFLWFRPYHFTPKSVDYFEVGARRFFNDEQTSFITVRGGIGRMPDIGDVPPLNQIIILQEDNLSVDGQIPLRKDIFFKAGLGYSRQGYSFGHVRHVTDGSVGIFWQF